MFLPASGAGFFCGKLSPLCGGSPHPSEKIEIARKKELHTCFLDKKRPLKRLKNTKKKY